MARSWWLLLAVLLYSDAGAQPRQVPAGADLLQFGSGPTFSITIPLDGRSPQPVRSRRAFAELGAAALTGVGQLVFSELDASAVYIGIVSVGWGGYVYYRLRHEPGFLRRIGLASAGSRTALRDATLLAAGSLALMAGVGAARGTLQFDREMVPLLALYPLWGLVQQSILQGFVAGNLAEGEGWTTSPYFIVPVTAALFSSVHYPSPGLMAGTFGLGLVITPHYLRYRTVWPLGLYHGWLGVCYYRWVLGRDPWAALRY